MDFFFHWGLCSVYLVCVLLDKIAVTERKKKLLQIYETDKELLLHRALILIFTSHLIDEFHSNYTNFTVFFFSLSLFSLVYLQIFHTIAIILLIISTLILLIGVTVHLLSYTDSVLKYEVPFVVSMFVASVSTSIECHSMSKRKRISIYVKQLNWFILNFWIVLQILNFLNALLYYTSIKLVRTTCENY